MVRFFETFFCTVTPLPAAAENGQFCAGGVAIFWDEDEHSFEYAPEEGVFGKSGARRENYFWWDPSITLRKSSMSRQGGSTDIYRWPRLDQGDSDGVRRIAASG